MTRGEKRARRTRLIAASMLTGDPAGAVALAEVAAS